MGTYGFAGFRAIVQQGEDMASVTGLTFLALCLPFLGAIIAPVAVRYLGHNAAWPLALFPALAFLHFAGFLPDIAAGHNVRDGFDWVPSLSLRFSWLLDGLSLTFALSAGDAIETPTWRALLPELVGKADLASASALNGIEFNIARAVGPALAGVLIAAAGVGAAFVVNAVSFVGVIVVIARWRRPVRRSLAPLETVSGATVAAIRYVRYSPELRAVMWRAGFTMFAASALLALLPAVARSMSGHATVYGVLLGCFGTGAVLGALAMQPARRR